MRTHPSLGGGPREAEAKARADRLCYKQGSHQSLPAAGSLRRNACSTGSAPPIAPPSCINFERRAGNKVQMWRQGSIGRYLEYFTVDADDEEIAGVVLTETRDIIQRT